MYDYSKDEELNYWKIRRAFLEKYWSLENFDGYYPGEERGTEVHIVQRYIAKKQYEDDILLYKDSKGNWWTSDPYNSDVELESLSQVDWILSHQHS